nr:helix-turn-helix domain-containing protein [Pinirhizobacter soli]
MLGTQLRYLIEHLDTAVEESYRQAGLEYRPRYTPVVRTLQALGPSTIRAISNHTGISHSGVSQTVSHMTKQGWVKVGGTEDGRERVVALSRSAERALPELEQCWKATAKVAKSLDAELSYPLSTLLEEAISALHRRPFGDRLASARRTKTRAGSE